MTETRKPGLANYQGPDRIISSHEMKILLSKAQEAIIRVKSSISSLDRWIEDFQGGDLISISGPTKHGKTLFAQTLTRNFARQHHFPLWFTFEVQARLFLAQFPETPLIYMPAKLKAHALPWVEERILESFEKFHTRIVFLDHLHYLVDLARMRNPSLEIGQVIRSLKMLAVDKGFVIFLLCHTTKSRPDDLSHESIRDSSFVAQESDSVFMIKRTPEEGETATRLRIEFHRRTGAMEKTVDLIKVNGFLEERTDRT